jgi:hypothetical protein
MNMRLIVDFFTGWYVAAIYAPLVAIWPARFAKNDPDLLAEAAEVRDLAKSPYAQILTLFIVAIVSGLVAKILHINLLAAAGVTYLLITAAAAAVLTGTQDKAT